MSQAGAARPLMIAAVLAMLASVQLAAATETVRQTGAAGQAGARVENVVEHVAAAPPAPGRGAGGGQATAVDGDDRGRPGRRVLGTAR